MLQRQSLAVLAICTLLSMTSLPSLSLLYADDASPAAIASSVDTTLPEGAAAATLLKEAEAKQAEIAPENPDSEAAEETAAVSSYFKGTFWALIPPILAIVLALITKEVYSSLFLGIAFGSILVNPSWKFFDTILNDGLISAVKDQSGIFVFLVILGIFVALLNAVGAAAAFGKWAQSHVKTRGGAILSTFVLGVLIFIDDYFNCLTVGSVMLPVCDSKKVSRAKLAYIIDATAAPICMIAPISSWAAAVSSYAEGTKYSGIELFVRAIPYNFYSLLTFFFIIFITLLKIDFGPMKLHEFNAQTKGDLFTYGKEIDNGMRPLENAHGKIIDIIIPIIILIAICVLALVYNGGILEGKSFITAFSDTDSTIALPLGGIISLIITMIYLLSRRIIKSRDIMEAVPKGFMAMVPAIIILTFATALKNMTGMLEAKEFIAGLMEHAAVGLDRFLPVVIFLVACILAFATGTSWGTFGILIPIVVNIFPETSPLLFIGMSACLAGAVCGDHCSPISDTTIMSSAGARCEHINHVSTQLPYAIFVAAFSAIGFILAGLVQTWYLVFPITVLLMLSGLLLTKKLVANK